MAVNSKKMTIPIRPLNKGIRRDTPSTMLPAGFLYDTEGAVVSDNGLARRDGFRKLFTLSGETGFRFISTYTNVTGDLEVVFITESGRFGAYNPVSGATTYYDGTYTNPDSYPASGTISTNTITLSSGSWYNTGAVEQDKITIDGNDYIIAEIVSATELTTSSSLLSTFSADIVWTITYLNLNYVLNESVDFCQYLTYFIFTDNTRPPLCYDGSSLSPVVTAARYRCKTLRVVKDYLYYANITWIDNAPSSAINNPTMLAWSDIPGDITTIDPTLHNLYLPYVRGEIVKLEILGNMLVSYFSYGIMIGRETTFSGSLLPFAFDRMETEERGIFNVNATAFTIDGNYFVTHDNVYSVTNSFEFTRVGTPISEGILKDNINYTKSMILNAPRQNYIFVFLAYATGTDNYDMCLAYNYIKQAWSRYSLSYSNFAIIDYTAGALYKDIDPTLKFSDLDPSKRYVDFTISTYGGYLAATKENTIYVAEAGLDRDEDASIYFYVETGDIDLNIPDKQKTFTRLSARLANSITSDLPFILEGSTTQGGTWNTLGTLTINGNEHEGHCTFLYTGSAVRFRLSTESIVQSFVITEIMLDVVSRGLQYDNMG